MTFKLHITVAPQPDSSNSLKVKSSALGWVRRMTSCLSVSQKISCGYGLAVSTVILGVATGFAIGDRYYQQAIQLREDAETETRLLNHLQNSVLKAQLHQRQFTLIQKPELLTQEYSEFLEHEADVKQVLSKIKSYTKSESYKNEPHAEGIPRFLQTYGGVPEAYFWQVDEILRQIDPHHLKPEETERLQKRLLNFTNSSVALKFHNLSDNLTEVIEVSNQEAERAEDALTAAQAIQFQIITASLLLSVAIATLLAIYTSQAIARPIQAVTKVAQRVTQEANFDLQAPVTTSDEVGLLAISLNQLIQRVNHLLEEQKTATKTQLMQSEKMSSLGRMIAGVAHEINNPVNFIYGNLVHASNYIEEMLALLNTYASEMPSPPKSIAKQAEAIDLDFLQEDLPKLMKSMQVGAERVKQIVLSLKNFSRLDEAAAHSVDLHTCIDSSLLILNNRIKKGIRVVRHYGDIPAVEGYTCLLYQVFMNLLSNAIDALEETAATSRLKEVVISTQCQDSDWVVVRIADNGSGIMPENQVKIFDAFFTTKPRGIGTGLGLAISHEIVSQKHGGQLTCKSEVGVGTEFAIALPIKHSIPTALISPVSQLPHSQQYLAS